VTALMARVSKKLAPRVNDLSVNSKNVSFVFLCVVSELGPGSRSKRGKP
jgi:hypothetical protein